jgi:hypothetical protein
MRPPLRSKSVWFALALSVYAGGLASSPHPTTAKDKPDAAATPRERAAARPAVGAAAVTPLAPRVPSP